MQHPYEALRDEYARLIAAATIRPECEHVLHLAATRLLHDKPVYARISGATGVPIAVLMALSEREMSGNLHCYLGNGQKLTMRTTIVPKNRGPFPDTIEGFIAGALDALAQLAAAYEGQDGWSLDALPPGNAAAQTKGIVAFRMKLTKVETKTKLSQNRELEDRQRVIAKLEASDGDDAKATADWMKRVLP